MWVQNYSKILYACKRKNVSFFSASFKINDIGGKLTAKWQWEILSRNLLKQMNKTLKQIVNISKRGEKRSVNISKKNNRKPEVFKIQL